MNDQTYDVLVVGGGVVGLSILRSATLHGWKCALVEAESDLLCWASGSNSGIACTGVDASPGTLERALIRDSVSQIRGYCQTHNIPHRPCGSLVCRWSWDNSSNNNDDENDSSGRATLENVLEESHDAGDTHASILSADEVQHLEPNLSKSCTGAVHIPGEIVVDPWLFSITYAVHARENGAEIFTNWKFDPLLSSFDAEQNVWIARRASSDRPGSSLDADNDDKPSYIRARANVNACGVWSDLVQKEIHRDGGGKPSSSRTVPAQWIAKPRRGQYRVFRTDQATHIEHPIQPIPTQRTKGIFVFGTLYDHVVVGPTALDQESRTDRSVDPSVSDELDRFVQKVIPSLDTKRAHVGDYVGIRPGTDKRDFQIHLSRKINWVAAGGIRSTGLTSSLGIGRHVVHLLDVVLSDPASPLSMVKTTPLPALPELIHEYRRRGHIAINGHFYRVTHPVTSLGWDAAKGISDPERLRFVSQKLSKL